MEDKPFNGSSPAKAFFIVFVSLAVLLTMLYFTYRTPSFAHVTNVRIRNDAGTLLQDVNVNGVAYGTIRAGEVTGYREMAEAYRYAKLQLVMSEKEIHLQPEDYVGEQRLGPGRFTYTIVFVATTKSVEIRAVNDGD